MVAARISISYFICIFITEKQVTELPGGFVSAALTIQVAAGLRICIIYSYDKFLVQDAE